MSTISIWHWLVLILVLGFLAMPVLAAILVVVALRPKHRPSQCPGCGAFLPPAMAICPGCGTAVR